MYKIKNFEGIANIEQIRALEKILEKMTWSEEEREMLEEVGVDIQDAVEWVINSKYKYELDSIFKSHNFYTILKKKPYNPFEDIIINNKNIEIEIL